MAVCHHYRIRHSEFLSWSDDDRDKAIWTHLRERSTCDACGTRAEEWQGENKPYVATIRRCKGCQEIQAMQASLDGSEGRGAYVALKPAPKPGPVDTGRRSPARRRRPAG